MSGDPNSALLEPEDRVLSTLEHDGSRRWLSPRLAHGRFLKGRRIVAYSLIAVFTLLPYIPVNGKPAVFLDILHREFTFFGFTFLPTDTLLLAIFMLAVFLTIFFVTALFGRVWCGWACPQTVYLEFVYRPIERLCLGRKGVGGKPARDVPGWRRAAMYAAYLAVSLYLAHTFLSYFVGVENLRRWILGSPLDHPVAFAVVMAVTGLMMFDFAFWREQLCIIGCPYGRFQSVMLDRQSLIIGYDEQRGEPRGPLRKTRNAPAVPLTVGASDRAAGDCIDCTLCVQVCPTGIDIRDGLQLECVGCAQCIDACDSVMARVGRPLGLIRYSSQAAIDGAKPRLIRPRTVVYPAAILGLATLFVVVLLNKPTSNITILREKGLPAIVADDGRVWNTMRIKIVNRTETPRAYDLAVAEPMGVEVVTADPAIVVEPGAMFTEPFRLIAEPDAFRGGRLPVTLRITDDQGTAYDEPALLLFSGGGPAPGAAAPPPHATIPESSDAN